MHKKFTMNALVPHLIVLGVLFSFVFLSYPMMYPGYDIWWHLDVIRSVEFFDGQSYGRWHWTWNRILRLLNIDNVFHQALTIHRTQFVISISCLYVSALLLVSAALRGRELKSEVFAVLGGVAVVYWMLMHGTSSKAPFIEEISAVSMAWINWYSVSHQIALPLYVLGTSLMIHTCAVTASSNRVRKLKLAGALVLVAFVGLLHAAEVPYFLYMAGWGVVLYAGRKRLFPALFLLALSLTLLAFVFSKIGHVDSLLLGRLLEGEWTSIFGDVNQLGDLMLSGKNRASTSWNVLYTVALVLSLVLVMISFRRSELLDAKVLFWLAVSASLPASIFFKYTSGLLAQVTYLDLAWRFSFGSLLFVFPSIFLGFIMTANDAADRGTRRLALLLAVGLFVLIPLSLHQGVRQGRSNLYSIVSSISPTEMRFGLSDIQESQLRVLSDRLKSGALGSQSCFDVFTSYYLFFVLDVRSICVPRRITEGPTYLMSLSSAALGADPGVDRCTCDFSRTNVSDGLQGMVPVWNYLLLK